jgi:hypothetical protein
MSDDTGDEEATTVVALTCTSTIPGVSGTTGTNTTTGTATDTAYVHIAH